MLPTHIPTEPLLSPPDTPLGTIAHWVLTVILLPPLLSLCPACSHSSPRKHTSAHFSQPPPLLLLLHFLPGPHTSLFQGPGVQDVPKDPAPCRALQV